MPLIPFHHPTLKDIPILQSFFRKLNTSIIGNDLNYANIYLLQDLYSTEISIEQNVLYRHYDENARFCGYAFPLTHKSNNLEEAIVRIESDAYERSRAVNFCLLTELQCHALKQIRPDCYTYSSHREDSDYIYNCKDLAELSNPQLRKKRNRLNHYLRKLEEKSSTWNIEAIHRGHFFEMLSIAQAWEGNQKEQGTEPTILGKARSGEFACLREALRYWRKLKLFGIMLRIDGHGCGFSVASKSNDSTVDVHYEKCLPDYRGAYPLLVRGLAQTLEIPFINREEDLGIEGLRKSKLSYQPTELINKYTAWRV